MFRQAGLIALMVVLAVASEARPQASSTPYDPLAVGDRQPSKPIEWTVHDAGRDRDIPILVYRPAAGEKSPTAAPVVLFSHGLGGSRHGSTFLGKHWAARGYVAVFIQHPGSDSAVWQDEAIGRRLATLKKAANADNFQLRVQDVPAVLDCLAAWNVETGHALAGQLDLKKVGMSGHSFGAVTTQAVSGQTYLGSTRLTDPRIRAAIALSPSPPKIGSPEQAFGGVKIPWLLMTGTLDNSPIGDVKAEARLKVFPALPKGSKYELVLDGAEHSFPTERPLPAEHRARNPNHQRAVLAISTAFWDAYLKDDPDARKWLDGAGPRSVLEPADRWQTR